MYIYTVKKQKFKKKFLKGGAQLHRTSQIRRLWRKGYANINTHLVMSCYIQVEYNVFFRW